MQLPPFYKEQKDAKMRKVLAVLNMQWFTKISFLDMALNNPENDICTMMNTFRLPNSAWNFFKNTAYKDDPAVSRSIGKGELLKNYFVVAKVLGGSEIHDPDDQSLKNRWEVLVLMGEIKKSLKEYINFVLNNPESSPESKAPENILCRHFIRILCYYSSQVTIEQHSDKHTSYMKTFR